MLFMKKMINNILVQVGLYSKGFIQCNEIHHIHLSNVMS